MRKVQIIHTPRASAILYTLLVSQKQMKPWLLPANICPIVPITFMKARVPFELIDISAKTLHMDLEQAESRIKTREVGGVLYAHTYGEETTPEDFFARAKSLKPEMLIVDDRCLCIPTFDAISAADVVLFSTGYAKVVDLGLGGYAFLKEETNYEPATLVSSSTDYSRLEGQYKLAVKERIRFNYFDSDWLITDSKLPKWEDYRNDIEHNLESSLAHRKINNGIYSSRLPQEIQLPAGYQIWRFNILLENREQIMRAIIDEQLFASSHYASLAGIMSDGSAPLAESLGNKTVNLFNDHHFTAEMAESICEIIVKNARW